jgi:hypothetical protein
MKRCWMQTGVSTSPLKARRMLIGLNLTLEWIVMDAWNQSRLYHRDPDIATVQSSCLKEICLVLMF